MTTAVFPRLVPGLGLEPNTKIGTTPNGRKYAMTNGIPDDLKPMAYALAEEPIPLLEKNGHFYVDEIIPRNQLIFLA